MLPVKRTIKNNKFLYRQPCYGWRYFMLLLYIAHDISLVSLHVKFVSHPDYAQLIPQSLETGEYIL